MLEVKSGIRVLWTVVGRRHVNIVWSLVYVGDGWWFDPRPISWVLTPLDYFEVGGGGGARTVCMPISTAGSGMSTTRPKTSSSV